MINPRDPSIVDKIEGLIETIGDAETDGSADLRVSLGIAFVKSGVFLLKQTVGTAFAMTLLSGALEFLRADHCDGCEDETCQLHRGPRRTSEAN